MSVTSDKQQQIALISQTKNWMFIHMVVPKHKLMSFLNEIKVLEWSAEDMNYPILIFLADIDKTDIKNE